METKLWYSLMRDNNDSDYGCGSFDREEVIKNAKMLRSIYPDVYIAVIDVTDDDLNTQICVEEIRDF